MVTLSPHCPQWFPQSFQLISLSLIGILKLLSALPVVRAKLASFSVEASAASAGARAQPGLAPLETSPRVLGGPEKGGLAGQRLRGMFAASPSLSQNVFIGLRTHTH